jgi:flavin reductase (DIM6/NTAB) family NADH-FMN oxidoreductase RutF
MGEDAAVPVSADDYRAVMRHWPSGVTVVTMPGPDGPHGMTASAFTSVSLHPPLVLIVVDQRWRSHDRIRAAGAFCVNILAEDQWPWADRFAGRHGPDVDRFAGVPTTEAVTGAPCFTDAVAFLDCQVAQAYDAGDHTIFVGRVVAARVNAPARPPLLYHDAAYTALRRAEGEAD